MKHDIFNYFDKIQHISLEKYVAINYKKDQVV